MNSKSKNSTLNAITAIFQTLTNGILGIIVVRLVIARYGSDFNGINATANQIVNVLLLLEGGMSLASNVLLFKPIVNDDINEVEDILSTTRNKFRKIGIVFILLGVLVSFFYSIIVVSSESRGLIFSLIFMAVFPSGVNLCFSTTYRVLLHALQKEYVINLTTAITIGLGHCANIITISLGFPSYMIRINTMVFSLLNCLIIICYVKKKYNKYKVGNGKIDVEIRGTKDVLAQKITGVIYESTPMMMISATPAGGTVIASVYSVYNSVYAVLKSLMHSFIDAPRLSIGQLIIENRKEHLWKVFFLYEYISTMAISILITITQVLIIPFIAIYMNGITDAQYRNPRIAIIMSLISFFEMMHIPSGHLMNMAGRFKESRKIQVISCVVLIISLLLGGVLGDMYWLMISILITAIILAILEMGYVHYVFFPGSSKEIIRLVCIFFIASLLIVEIESPFIPNELSIWQFIIIGGTLTIINTVLLFIVSYLFYKDELKSMCNYVALLTQKRKNKHTH